MDSGGTDGTDRADGDQTPTDETEDEYKTLKYHLLGPSLTKAGQDSVDQQKVSAPTYLDVLEASTEYKGFGNYLQRVQRVQVLQP